MGFHLIEGRLFYKKSCGYTPDLRINSWADEGVSWFSGGGTFRRPKNLLAFGNGLVVAGNAKNSCSLCPGVCRLLTKQKFNSIPSRAFATATLTCSSLGGRDYGLHRGVAIVQRVRYCLSGCWSPHKICSFPPFEAPILIPKGNSLIHLWSSPFTRFSCIYSIWSGQSIYEPFLEWVVPLARDCFEA